MGTKNGSAVAGLILIALGVVFLIGQRVDLGGAFWLICIGTVFVVAYLGTRSYGLLIPGGILLGLGTGEWLDHSQLGLGLGFISIFVIDCLVYRAGAATGAKLSHWWPLIPGVIIVIGPLLQEFRGIRRIVRQWWPLVLIGIGIYVLLQGRKSKPLAAAESGPPAGTGDEA